MKQTLLEMVQDILNDMDSDEVNSFSDTTEAFQVAQILKTTFYEMLTRKDWQHLRQMTTLESLSQIARPNFLVIPEEATRMDYFAYNQKKEVGDVDRFDELQYLYPDEFVRHCNGRNPNNDNVESVTSLNGIRLNILNDQAPTYWTTFDDKHIACDSYARAVQSTLTGSESQVELYLSPSWTMEDGFIPFLPVEAFPALLAEAKSVSFVKLKQVEDAKAEQQSVRQHNMLAQRGWVAKGGVRYQNYGRRSGKSQGYPRGRHFNRNQYTGG